MNVRTFIFGLAAVTVLFGAAAVKAAEVQVKLVNQGSDGSIMAKRRLAADFAKPGK